MAIMDTRHKAEQGNAHSQFELGYMYANGYVVGTTDQKKAAYWYEKAAEQGHITAQKKFRLSMPLDPE